MAGEFEFGRAKAEAGAEVGSLVHLPVEEIIVVDADLVALDLAVHPGLRLLEIGVVDPGHEGMTALEADDHVCADARAGLAVQPILAGKGTSRDGGRDLPAEAVLLGREGGAAEGKRTQAEGQVVDFSHDSLLGE